MRNQKQNMKKDKYENVKCRLKCNWHAHDGRRVVFEDANIFLHLCINLASLDTLLVQLQEKKLFFMGED